MATQLQLQLRRDEAYKRIDAATRALGAKPGDLARHRDPAIEQILRIEAIADSLEQLAKGQGKGEPINSAEAVAKVEAELEAETGKDFVQTTQTPPVLAETDKPKGKAK